MKKKLLSLSIAIMLLFSFFSTACTPNQPTSETPPPESAPAEVTEKEPEVTLVVWEFSKWKGVTGTEPDGQPDDWMKAMAANFTEMYPNVSFEIEVFDFQAGQEKANIALQSGQIPAVIHNTDTNLNGYANKGYLLPIEEYLDDEYMANFNDNAFDIARIGDGKAYWIPFAGTPCIMMVNKTLFEKAGTLDLLPQNEERTWTYEEYYTAIKTTQEKLSGVYGTANTGVLYTGDAFTLQWIWGAGGTLIADSLDSVAVNEPKAMEGLSFWKKIIDDGLQAPGGATAPVGDLYPLFTQQKILTTLCATTQYARTTLAFSSGDAEEFEIMIVMPPTIDGKPVTTSFPHGFAVPTQTDPSVEKYALLFAQYLGGPENATAMTASKEFSFQKNTDNMYDDSGDPNMIFATSAMQYVRSSGTAAAGFNALRQALTPEFQRLYAGDITVEQFCEYAEREGTPILQQAIEKLK